MGGDKHAEEVTEKQGYEKTIEALEAVVPDLEHYVSTHGPGPDVRLAAFKAALADVHGLVQAHEKQLKYEQSQGEAAGL